MPYESLIAALLEEGAAKCQAVLSKARTEADRVIAEAAAAAEALDREADLQFRHEAARRRTEILSRAVLSGRQILLQAKHEVLEAVWRRATEKALALSGAARTQVLEALLEELLAAAPPGSLKALIDERERVNLERRLKEKGLPFEVQRRDDLVLGTALEASGELLRSSLTTRLAKAKPELTMELNRLLFAEQQAGGQRQGARGTGEP
jgi:vacuolar-type H+-ATPase subunit E/Vma4